MKTILFSCALSVLVHTVSAQPLPEIGAEMLQVDNLRSHQGGGGGDRYSIHWWKGETLLLLPQTALVRVVESPDGLYIVPIDVGRGDTLPVRLSSTGAFLFLRKVRDLSLPWVPNASEFFVAGDLDHWELLIDDFWIGNPWSPDGKLLLLPRDDVFEDRGCTYASPGDSVNLVLFNPLIPRWDTPSEFPISIDRGIGVEFFISDGIALWGGEGTALDSSAMWRGELAEDGHSWQVEPTEILSTSNGDFKTPGGSSGPQFIEIDRNPTTGTFFLGLEPGSGIFRGNSDGTQFEPVPGTENVGIVDFCFPSHNERFVLAGGKRADTASPWIGWSADDGFTWTDVSDLVKSFGSSDHGEVVFLAEDPQNGIVAGILSYDEDDLSNQTLTVVEVVLPGPARNVDTAATLHTNGWARSPTLGLLWADYYPWVWMEAHEQWFWTANSLQEGLWLWDSELGWTWTGDGYYPWLWNEPSENWLWFGGAGEEGRWFWSAEAADWIQIQ